MEVAVVTGAMPEKLLLFLTTGFMGGYTTYSSFNHETLRLARSGASTLALLNVAATVLTCVASGVAGILAARALVRLGLFAVAVRALVRLRAILAGT